MPMCKTVDHCYEDGSKTVVDRYHSGNNLGTGPVLFQYYNVYWELLLTTVGEHSQRSLTNENDLKEMKGRTETFRGSFIPDAIKRYNNNQKGNVIDGNNNIAVKMNKKLFE